jgi:two-component system sensor histidine kinase DesK
MEREQDPTRRREHIRGTIMGGVWAVIWMFPLLQPATDLVQGRIRPALPAALGLAVFVVLYLVTVVSAFGDRIPDPRLIRRLLGPVAVVGVALAAVYGARSDGWLSVLLYVAVTGAITLVPPYVHLWVGGTLVALVAVGVGHGMTSGSIGQAAFTVIMASALVFLLRRMVRMIRELRQAQEQLAEAAVAQERLRFARDLHDLLGHTLSIMVVKAEAVRRLLPRDPATAADQAADIEQIGRRALVDVREAVTGYRTRSLSAELDGARAALAGAGVEVTVREQGLPLSGTADDLLGWVVREGVTNVVRHAGAAHCEIEVRRVGERASVEIRDDGTGAGMRPGALPPGHGLRGLAERLDSAGGTLHAAPRPGGGFRLTAEVPA